MIKSYAFSKLTFEKVSGLIKHLKPQEERTFTLSPAHRTIAVELEHMLVRHKRIPVKFCNFVYSFVLLYLILKHI